MNWLPPSGAVTGLFVRTDRDRGIFKAPANASLAEVVETSRFLNLRHQEYMNVHHTGKTVNALLPLVGRGIVVHGSRTLDSNSQDWRYVPVRRYFLAIEALMQENLREYVFEPNAHSTWTKLRAVLDGYLDAQWREGALRGRRPEEAWFVEVGLGETMDETDLLEGRLIVRIGLAVVRPAEFISLTFTQQLESN